MKKLLVGILLLVPVCTFAYQPILVFPDSSDDNIVIEQPQLERTYFGDLEGFPHTYEIVVRDELDLFVQILVPDIESSESNKSGIIVQKVERGVQEVARMHYRDSQWDSFYDSSTGDRYRYGGEFQGVLESGTYLFEVSSGDNIGKYVLLVGKGEAFSDSGYFQKLSDTMKIKYFFEKPMISVFQSPYYYIPLALLLLMGLFYYRKYKKQYAS